MGTEAFGLLCFEQNPALKYSITQTLPELFPCNDVVFWHIFTVQIEGPSPFGYAYAREARLQL